MNEVLIIDAVRTPIGRHGGALSDLRPDDLLALVLRELMLRNPTLPPEAIEDVVAGAANQAGEDNRNVARMAALLAGLPPSVPGVTVNRLCASGLQAVVDAWRMLAVGEGQAAIAGGVESMTRAPFVMAKSAQPWGRNIDVFDTTFGWRFLNPRLAELYHPYSMGETAENVAERYDISRQDQDEFALQSQMRYKAAHDRGAFAAELVPVSIPQRKGNPRIVALDEHPRPDTTPEALANLRPAFKAGGTVTAGNASGINDGAAALLLCTRSLADAHGLQPRARILATAVVGVDPAYMGIGPVPAIQKVLARTQLGVKDIDLWEINEAFAAQSVACVRELGIDPLRVNVNGGAIALGHPLGASGARILTTLVHELGRRQDRYGIASLCVGVGQGLAVLVENLHR
jgi:3-oxoadipyl-CoA thiolase